jgi:HemY protein
MLRAFWFLVKLSLFAGALIWVTQQPANYVTITAGIPEQDAEQVSRWALPATGVYEIQIQTYFFLFLVLCFLFIVTRLDRIWRAFVSVPKVLRRYRALQKREKGYRAVTQGLVAIAAGDSYGASRLSQRAEILVPGTPLTRLLTAQTALLNGDSAKARREFTALLDDDSAAFLGVRGLLSEAVSAGDHAAALELIRRADKLQPKRVWVVKNLFELETRNRAWLLAERTLRRAEKLGIYSKVEAAAKRQAIWTAMAEEAAAKGDTAAAMRMAESAFNIGHGFTPAAVLLAKLQAQVGKRNAALKTILKGWKANPHPALSALWAAHAPAPGKNVSPYDIGRGNYQWMQHLQKTMPDSRDGLRALGNAALDAKLWKEAREPLTAAQDYRALARLEREEKGDEAKAREWLEMAADAPTEPRWVCGPCGHAAAEWQAVCTHCGQFGASGWSVPVVELHEPLKRAVGYDAGILSPPA